MGSVGDPVPAHVLILSPSPQGLRGGGLERMTIYLTRGLRTVDPSLKVDRHASRWSRQPVLAVLSTPASLVVFFVRCLLRRYTAVHINVGRGGGTWRKMAFAAAARAAGRPIVMHLHASGYDTFYEGLPPPLQAAVRQFFRGFDAVVVLGAFWCTFATERLGVPAARLHAIPNGVPAARSRANPGDEPAHIVFVGLVGERKGTDVLVHAARALANDVAGWRLTIAGNGDVEEYRQLASSLGIADRVVFTGWAEEDEVDRLLCSASIFVLPTRSENQPVSILEAMARGLPVVSTRVHAIPEMVRHGETGLLVEAGNVADLAAALRQLIDSPSTRQRMGAAGLTVFEAHYAIEETARRFSKLYRSYAHPSPTAVAPAQEGEA